jgi:hypothetical protein
MQMGDKNIASLRRSEKHRTVQKQVPIAEREQEFRASLPGQQKQIEVLSTAAQHTSDEVPHKPTQLVK